MFRDSLGRFARSGFLRKTAKYGLVLLVAWFCVWSFKTHFNIIKQDGIYGVVTEDKWHSITQNALKAQAYDTIPEFYYQ